MNDIKFRAWDKKNKKFLKPYREQHIGNWVNKLSINMDGSLGFHEDDGFGGKIIGGESIEKRFELIQYTGLKDVNGVEIYEGYVVLFDSKLYPVEFKNGNFGVKKLMKVNLYTDEMREYQEPLWNLVVDGCEVIGNIYENTELLGENQ